MRKKVRYKSFSIECNKIKFLYSQARIGTSRIVKTVALLMSAILLSLVIGCSDSEEIEIKDIDIDMDILRPTETDDSAENNRGDRNYRNIDRGEPATWDISNTGYITFPDCDHAKYVMGISREDFAGETITLVGYEFFLQDLVELYIYENPGVTIEIVDIWEEHRKPYGARRLRERIIEGFEAGEGPVLLDSFALGYLTPCIASYLVDWFTFMGADPDFQQEEWLTNVFIAQSREGHLYEFPREFNFNLATINTTIADYEEIWGDRELVTLIELMELHQALPLTYPFLFERNFNVFSLMIHSLGSFMDYESGWVNFDNEIFTELITYAKDITCPEVMLGRWIGTDIVIPSEEIEMSEQFFFNIRLASTMYQYIVDLGTSLLFGEIVPLVNGHNELLIEVGNSFVLNANATPVQQALAWDFLNFISSYNLLETRAFFGFPGLPTNIETLHLVFAEDISDLSARVTPFGWRIDNEATAVEDLVKQLTPIMSMPMAVNAVPREILNVISEALSLFHDGEVSAEQTAADMQRRVVQIMRETGKIE